MSPSSPIRSLAWGALCATLLSACAGDDGGGVVGACNDAPVAPTLSELALVDQGTVDFNGESVRAVFVSALATDPDMDLHSYTAQVWVDTIEDGAVSGSYDVEVTAETGTECMVEEATVGAIVRLGDTVPAGANVDLGLVIFDASGLGSNGGEPTVFSVRSPDL